MTYFETSCKTGENIQDFFEQIASDLVRRYHPKLVSVYLVIFSIKNLFFLQLESHLPVLNNFAFNYHVPPTIDHKLSEKLRNANNQQVNPSRKKRKFKRPKLLSERSCFYRFFICCNPRKTNEMED
jgi:hypothetical protein